MENYNLQEALKKQKSTLEDMGYTVVFICVYGSQNYLLDVHTEEYQSDIDMKAVVVPNLAELVKNSKPVSKIYETEWGQVDVKDIRSYAQTLLKANPTYIETLFTPHYIIDSKFEESFENLLEFAPELLSTLKAQFIRAVYGMMCEKQKAMTHPYPTIAHKIEKYGWDGKQAHHIYRLRLILQDYFVDKISFYDCLCPDFDDVGLLLDLKLNKLTLEQVTPLVEEWMNEAKNIKDKFLNEIDESKIDYSIKDKYIEFSNDIIKKNVEKEIVQKIANKVLEDYR